jgi:hypothetical protein
MLKTLVIGCLILGFREERFRFVKQRLVAILTTA